MRGINQLGEVVSSVKSVHCVYCAAAVIYDHVDVKTSDAPT